LFVKVVEAYVCNVLSETTNRGLFYELNILSLYCVPSNYG